MTKANNKEKVLYVWIPKELYKKLKIKTIRDDTTIKEVILTYLHYYCKEEKKSDGKKQQDKKDTRTNKT